MDIRKCTLHRKPLKAALKMIERLDSYFTKIKRDMIHGDKLKELYNDRSTEGRKKYKEYLKEINNGK